MSVTIAPSQLPPSLRPLLAAVTDANATAQDLTRRLSVAHPDARPQLQQELDDTAATGRAALAELADATRSSAFEMRQYAENQFVTTIEQARAELQTAEATLREAAGLAAVAVAIRNGKTNLDPANSPAAHDSPARRTCVRLAAELRGMELPDLD